MEFLKINIEEDGKVWSSAKLVVVLLKDLPSTSNIYLLVLVRIDFKDEKLGIEFGKQAIFTLKGQNLKYYIDK